NTTATFDTTPKTMEEQEEWFDQHDEDFPILAAALDDQIVGWASISAWSDRCAYSDTAEGSTYVHAGHRGKGIGTQLARAIIDRAKKAGIHTILARVAEGNAGSLALLATLGFEEVGIMKEVGFKFGKRLDVHLLQIVFTKEP
ncbi:MAG: N-acetyltransferase family protein, partial [Candidatus Latescibacteria bacterium]|nr:N-acetyltransferase family protein [Candidatus Latescibacterota bacterium]